MLIHKWEKQILKSKCNPSQKGVHCIISVDADLSEVIPYLNAELGGDFCSEEPRYVTFKIHGKLLTVHPHKIVINALKDFSEADKVANWIVGQINEVWEHKNNISPTYEVPRKLQPFDILKYLPKTNCKKCNSPTCMVFAVLVSQGIKDIDECPELSAEHIEALKDYIKNA